MSEIKVKSNVLLVFMLLFQLILPVLVAAENSSVNNDAIEPEVVEVQSLDEDIESTKLSDVTDEDIGDEKEETIEVNEKESSTVEEEVKKPVEDKNKPNEKEKQEENKSPPVKEDKKVEENVKEEPKAKSDSEKIDQSTLDKSGISDSMLDGFPATPHPDNPTPLTMFEAGSLGSATVGMKTDQKMTLQAEDLQPGEVRTSKTAKPVPGMVNTWDVTVRVEGRDNNIVQKTDIVLVLDRSGSMEGTRLTNLKIAGKNFIDQTIPFDPGIQIAIVSFSSEYQGAPLYRIDHEFSKDIGSLKVALDDLVALGGTHTQAGILQGRLMFNGSQANNKYMILLSDGEPTYSYQPASWTTGPPSWGTAGGYSWGNNRSPVYDGNYLSSSVLGTGSALTAVYNETYRYHIHNGLAAIRAGQDARVGIDKLYTIGLEVNTTTEAILQQIASPGAAYRANAPADLLRLYNEVRSQIMSQSALRDAIVHDEMGDGFSIVPNSITKTEGLTSVANANTTNNDTITWNLSPQVNQLVPGKTDVRYAEMTYRIQINPSILNAPIATPGTTVNHNLFKTNKVTRLSYKDINNISKQKDITSPEVDPVLLRIKKNLIDAKANEARRFRVRISGSGNFNETVDLIPNGDYLWLTTLRHEGAYSVEEINVVGNPTTPLSQFIISYVVDGSSGKNFNVNHNGAIPRGDVVIDVTNREIRKINVTGTKVWQGGPTVKPAVTLQLYRNGVALGAAITLNHPATTYTWTNLDEINSSGTAYSYTIAEVNAPAGYVSTATGLTVTNIYQIPNDGQATAIKIWQGNDSDDFSGIPLTLWRTLDGITFEKVPNVSPTITQDPIINPNEQTYRYLWDELVKTDFYGNPYTFYFTEDEEVDGYERTYLDTTTTATVDGVIKMLALSGGRVRNREMKVDFSFVKVDEVGDDLSGAIFELHRHDGTDRVLVQRIGDITPGSNFNFTGLTKGTYTLTEVSGPDGYVLPEDNSWTFEVVWNDVEKKLEILFEAGDEIDGEIANYPVGMLPETGGSGTQIYLLIGMISLMALGTIYVWRTKGDEVNQHD